MKELQAGFCLLFFLTAGTLWGQQRTLVEIRHADRLRGIKTDSTEIRVATGDVQFHHEGTDMWCDSALVFVAFNRIEAFGNIRIQQADTLRISGRELQYDGRSRSARLTGNVVLQQRDLRLTTDALQYNLDTRVASYTSGATVQNDSTTLTSQIGYYSATTHMAYFNRSVQLTNKNYELISDTLDYDTDRRIAYFQSATTITSSENTIYCEDGWYDTEQEKALFLKNARLTAEEQEVSADSIYYERTIGFGRATGNVVFTDTTQDIVLLAGQIDFYEASNKVLAFREPTVIYLMDGDSLFIKADTLLSIEDSLQQSNLTAWPSVAILKQDLQGRCDSLVFDRTDSVLHLFQDPVMWSDSNQFTADTIRIYYKEEGLDHVDLRVDAFMATLNDTLIYNQVKGREITGYFIADSLRRLDVNGNGTSIYYALDEEDAYLGVNKVESSRIRILIAENAVKRITFLGSPDAKLEPMQQIDPAQFILEGFRWLGDSRPRRPEFRP